jgi:transposase
LPHIRSEDDEESPSEPHIGLQGESGVGRDQGGEDAGGIGQQFDVHPNQITQWRSQLLDGAAGIFGRDKNEATAPAVDLKALHAKIGELALENDFLSGALGKAGLLSAKR